MNWLIVLCAVVVCLVVVLAARWLERRIMSRVAFLEVTQTVKPVDYAPVLRDIDEKLRDLATFIGVIDSRLRAERKKPDLTPAQREARRIPTVEEIGGSL